MPFAFGYLWRSASFWVVIGLFAVGNLLTFSRQSDAALNAASYGFPFPVFVPGDSSPEANFYVTGLLLNIALPFTIGLLVVWIARWLRNDASAR